VAAVQQAVSHVVPPVRPVILDLKASRVERKVVVFDIGVNWGIGSRSARRRLLAAGPPCSEAPR
jgi:hypothetical protein